MSTLPNDNCFVFVVKTDSYAGNFEREMCGYMTGQYGECDVGNQQAEIFKKECPDNYDEFEDLVTIFPDEHGCHRPATAWGGSADVAIFLEARPTDVQLILMKDRARKFAAMTNPYYGGRTHITISGFELREYRVSRIDIKVAVWDGDE